MLLLIFTGLVWHPGVPASLLLCLPLIADGAVQALTAYESKNSRRFWTGLLFGYGIANIFLISAAAAFRCGFVLGLELRA